MDNKLNARHSKKLMKLNISSNLFNREHTLNKVHDYVYPKMIFNSGKLNLYFSFYHKN